jgi:hypothetical protein
LCSCCRSFGLRQVRLLGSQDVTPPKTSGLAHRFSNNPCRHCPSWPPRLSLRPTTRSTNGEAQDQLAKGSFGRHHPKIFSGHWRARWSSCDLRRRAQTPRARRQQAVCCPIETQWWVPVTISYQMRRHALTDSRFFCPNERSVQCADCACRLCGSEPRWKNVYLLRSRRHSNDPDGRARRPLQSRSRF